MKEKIVRIFNKNFFLNDNLYRILLKIYGIGPSLASLILKRINKDKKSILSEDIDLKKLEKNIRDFKRKDWMNNFNQRNQSENLLEEELILKNRKIIKELKENKGYRGIFHSRGKKVRGQNTRHNGRKNKKKIKYNKS